jgi:hypothetical protein
MTEALLREARHFVTHLRTRAASGARAGLRIVLLLEAATLSMRERSRVVELDLERCVA